MNEDFFDEQKEQSAVKSAIVAKYFDAWSRIMITKSRAERIAYIDLFSGPGTYDDGSPSTPILILQKAIDDPKLQKMLVTIFNDKCEAYAKNLSNQVTTTPGIENLTYKPKIFNSEVDERLAEKIGQKKLVPTLVFIDPFGYKGVSLQLIKSFLQNWGCDCILFFNYNRINPALMNPIVDKHMYSLFGETRANLLKEKLPKLSPSECEMEILEEFANALHELGCKYVLPFKFKTRTGNKTSHHIFFLSKHVLGYDIMKQIMAKESTDKDQGVSSFEYNPATKKYPRLFALSSPIDDLEEMLLKKFAGKTIKMIDIFNRHNVGTNYKISNYRDALKSLESKGKIITSKHKKGTFGDEVIVTFPDRSE